MIDPIYQQNYVIFGIAQFYSYNVASCIYHILYQSSLLNRDNTVNRILYYIVCSQSVVSCSQYSIILISCQYLFDIIIGKN